MRLRGGYLCQLPIAAVIVLLLSSRIRDVYAQEPSATATKQEDPSSPTSTVKPAAPEQKPEQESQPTPPDETASTPEQVALTWIAPEDCSRHDQVLSEVLRLIRPVKEPKPVDVTGTVTHQDETWSLDLDFAGSVTGTRSFSSSECESLAAAAAVIIALAINEERPLETPLPEPRPEPPPVVLPPVTPPPPKRPEPIVPSNQLYLGLGASLETGLAPIAIGPFVSLGFHHQELRGDLVLGGQPERSVASQVPGVSANLSVLWFGARGCQQFINQAFALFGCASLRLGRLTAEGQGSDIAAQENSEWVSSLLPGLLFRWPAKTALALELGVESSVPLTRPRVVILRDASDSAASSIEVYRVAPIGVAAHAALSFNLLSL